MLVFLTVLKIVKVLLLSSIAVSIFYFVHSTAQVYSQLIYGTRPFTEKLHCILLILEVIIQKHYIYLILGLSGSGNVRMSTVHSTPNVTQSDQI